MSIGQPLIKRAVDTEFNRNVAVTRFDVYVGRARFHRVETMVSTI